MRRTDATARAREKRNRRLIYCIKFSVQTWSASKPARPDLANITYFVLCIHTTQPRHIQCLSQTKIEYMVIFGGDPNRMIERGRDCRRACGVRCADITQNFIHDHCYLDALFFFSPRPPSPPLLRFFFCLFGHRKGSPIGRRTHCVLVADRSRSVSKREQILCMQSKFVYISILYTFVMVDVVCVCARASVWHFRMVIIMDVSEAMRTLLVKFILGKYV